MTFTADDSIQASGFSAVFSTSSSPLVALPSCRDKEQLVQVGGGSGGVGSLQQAPGMCSQPPTSLTLHPTGNGNPPLSSTINNRLLNSVLAACCVLQVSVRTRQFGSEISWVLTAAGSASVQQSEVLLSGGWSARGLHLALQANCRQQPTNATCQAGSCQLCTSNVHGDWALGCLAVCLRFSRAAPVRGFACRNVCHSRLRTEHSTLLAGPSCLYTLQLPAGGQLPSSLRVVLPEGSTSDPYKDYRSYPSYTCLAPGTYTLRLYDSYGDGWSGAVITVTQLVGGNAAMGCELVRETCTSNTRSVNVQITVSRCSSCVCVEGG